MSGDILPAQAFKLQGEPAFNAGDQSEDRRIGGWDVCREGEEGCSVVDCLEEGGSPLADDAVFPGLDRQRSLNEFVRLVARDDESTTHEGGGKVCEGQNCDGGKSSGEAHVGCAVSRCCTFSCQCMLGGFFNVVETTGQASQLAF